MKNMETRFVGLVNESPKKSWYCVSPRVKKAQTRSEKGGNGNKRMSFGRLCKESQNTVDI